MTSPELLRPGVDADHAPSGKCRWPVIDMGAKKETTIQVPHSLVATTPAVERALLSTGMQIASRSQDGRSVAARTPASLWSLGEQMAIHVDEHTDGTCTVRASSEAGQLFDWGKNAQNLQQFQQALFSALRESSPALPHPPARLPEAPAPRPDASAPAVSAAGTHRVFVSYRREDSAIIVGRICDRLARETAVTHVFKDVDNIPFGVDFVDHLDHEVERCTVLFAVIGPRWLEPSATGSRRIDDPNDFVRIEICSALRRRIPVVPLLVDGARMPRAEELPEDLHPLARRQGIDIRHDPDFHNDMTRLLSRLGASAPGSPA